MLGKRRTPNHSPCYAEQGRASDGEQALSVAGPCPDVCLYPAGFPVPPVAAPPTDMPSNQRGGATERRAPGQAAHPLPAGWPCRSSSVNDPPWRSPVMRRLPIGPSPVISSNSFGSDPGSPVIPRFVSKPESTVPRNCPKGSKASLIVKQKPCRGRRHRLPQSPHVSTWGHRIETYLPPKSGYGDQSHSTLRKRANRCNRSERQPGEYEHQAKAKTRGLQRFGRCPGAVQRTPGCLRLRLGVTLLLEPREFSA